MLIFQIVAAISSVFAIPSGILSALEIRNRYAKKPEEITSTLDSKRRGVPYFAVLQLVATLLVVLSVFWLIWHTPEKAVQTPCQTTEQQPQKSTLHVQTTPPPQKIISTESLVQKHKSKDPTYLTSVAKQSGIGNEQNVAQGTTIIQQSGGGDGSCTQNVGIGSNNINNCAPVPISISDAQEQALVTYLKKAPDLAGRVKIVYEYDVENGDILSGKLQNALAQVNIPATISGAQMIGGCEPVVHPGISLSCVVPTTKTLANAIEGALLSSKVIIQPQKAITVLPWGDTPLVILIRKP